MRRLIFATLLAITISSSTGCFIPIYDADPAIRARQLIFTAERPASNATGMASILVPGHARSSNPLAGFTAAFCNLIFPYMD